MVNGLFITTLSLLTDVIVTVYIMLLVDTIYFRNATDFITG